MENKKTWYTVLYETTFPDSGVISYKPIKVIKGNYNGEIPILNIISIEKTNKPENPNVSMPDSSYVPTAVIY